MKILLVDDEPNVRRIASIALRKVAGFDVVEADGGIAALALAASERPDVILLDVQMPDIDGHETFRRLAATSETASIPVIFITASVVRGEEETCLTLGAKGVLQKPFDPMTLGQRVLSILEA